MRLFKPGDSILLNQKVYNVGCKWGSYFLFPDCFWVRNSSLICYNAMECKYIEEGYCCKSFATAEELTNWVKEQKIKERQGKNA